MTPMSAAAERKETDNPLSSTKFRRGERKRKAGRACAESVERVATLAVAGAVGVVFLLLISSSVARTLRPAKVVEPPPAPVLVASNMKLREVEPAPPVPTSSEPPGPMPPIFAPPAEDVPDDNPPPAKDELPKPEPPKPEPPPAAPEQKPKADDPPPKPPAPPPPPVSANRPYKGPSEFELLKQLANTQDVGLT